MSLFWSQWSSKFWSEDVVNWLVQDWHITLIRAAMGVESGGYLESRALEKQRVATIVDAAIRNGIYVIIDWHDHHASMHQDDARSFFSEMAAMYGKYPNVFFEIFNEPLLVDWTGQIKPYEQEIVNTIRQHTDNLVICGTRAWSQDVELAASDPLQGKNLAYTLHFYATSHRDFLRTKAQVALSKGVALFATEWGTCRADGDGAVDFEETQLWLDFLEEHGISDANWAVNDKQESCAALVPGTSEGGGWLEDMLTESGRFVRSSLRGDLERWRSGAQLAPTPAVDQAQESTEAPTEAPTQPPTSAQLSTSQPVASQDPALQQQCSSDSDNCRGTRCCQTQGHRCFEKSDFWASCLPSCVPGLHESDPPEYRTPWSCELLEPVQFLGSQLPPGFLAPAGSTVQRHGAIRIEGARMLDEHGQPVRLRGMSLFWSQWGSKFWSSDVVKWLVEDWHITLIRAAMGVESGGYLESREVEKQRVATIVDSAIRNGIYVIIDWHDHHASSHTDDARQFFNEMAMIYGKYPNVFFEIFNEPLLEDWSSQIKPYEQDIVNTIRQHTDNLVICGTRTWSQDVELAALDPVQGSNLAYTLHFYATSHRDFLRMKAQVAMSKGIALFATEWGTCSADGNGALDFAETQLWLDFLEENGISDANWAVNDKQESCAALVPGTPRDGNWLEDMLTESGRFVRSSLRGEDLRRLVEEQAADWDALLEGEDVETDAAIDGAFRVAAAPALLLALLAALGVA